MQSRRAPEGPVRPAAAVMRTKAIPAPILPGKETRKPRQGIIAIQVWDSAGGFNEIHPIRLRC